MIQFALIVFSLFATPHGDLGASIPVESTREVVNVYSARHYDTDDELYERFERATGIEVRVIEGSSDALLTRLDREGRLSPADVLITVDAGRLHKAVEQGLFAPIESRVLSSRVPASLRHPDGLWFGLTKRVRVIVASKERVEQSEIGSYEELAEARWRGRVLVRSSSNIYNQSLVASFIVAEGPERAKTWCEGLVRNFARTPQGGDRDQIRAVAAGEGDVALVNHYYYARMLGGSRTDREAAEKLRVIFPNQDGRGAHVNVSGAGVLRTAPNRENAIRFLEFLVTDDAQRVFAAGNQEYPVVEGVEPTALLRSLGTFEQDTVPAASLGKHNAQAVRIMDRAGWR